MTEDELTKMELVRHLLEPPAPEVVGQLLAEVRRLRKEVEWLQRRLNEPNVQVGH